jgi:aspartyl-tRNA(Asn)/glutamyl-tRNA(Gln) amidotransferase subunit C
MALTRNDVEKVSLLARLQLTDDELNSMTEHLSQIIQYVHQLDEINTDDVAPLAHALDITNVLADDVVEGGLSRDAALQNAPQRDEECFRVPAVL